MTIPTNPNEPKKKKRNAVAGESLGSGVQSRVGGTEGQEPLRSSNELNIPKVTPPPITTDNSGVNRLKTIMKTAPMSKDRPITPPEQKADSGYLKFEGKEFDENAANEKLDKSDYFKAMLQAAKDEDEEYRKKSERASKQAKMAAWGNLFTALGQVAGGAKQTYVRPDSKYLTDAMAKSDKAREVYDAIKAKNRDAETKYRAAFMENERKAHSEAEKLRKSAYDEYNKLLQKGKYDDAKLALETMIATNKIRSTDYSNETARISALAARKNANTREDEYNLAKDKFGHQQVVDNRKWNEDMYNRLANAYTSYTDTDNGYQYPVSEGMARQIADLMIRSGKSDGKKYTGKDFGLENKYGTLKEGDITIADLKDNNMLKNAVEKFIVENANTNTDLQNLLKSTQRQEYTPETFMSALGNEAFWKELEQNPAMMETVLTRMSQSNNHAMQKIMEKLFPNAGQSTGSTSTASNSTGTTIKDVNGIL